MIKAINILWITAGLGCDGDTIALTAATQPTLEELLMGGMPGIPKVNFHNPFLAYENGEAFMDFFHRPAAGEMEPFEIGARLGISSRTAETHRSNLMHKLDLHTQADLIRFALRRGIIPMED